jgi:hypothetical protein
MVVWYVPFEEAKSSKILMRSSGASFMNKKGVASDFAHVVAVSAVFDAAVVESVVESVAESVESSEGFIMPCSGILLFGGLSFGVIASSRIFFVDIGSPDSCEVVKENNFGGAGSSKPCNQSRNCEHVD